MPYNLDPNQSAISSTQDFGYKYPEGLDLRPGSPLHQDLLTKILQRARESSNEISKKYASWRSVDETLTAYISTDDAEELLKKADSRKPISIVVPFSYATLETLLTYFVAAFLDSPIFKYEGTSPEDVLGAILMEKVVDQNVARSKAALNLHTMWRDSFAYGIGAVSPGWTKEWGYKTKFVDQGFFSSIFSRFVNEGKRRIQEEAIIYEGNKLSNIDPYLYLPDPNVPAHEPQRGEFNGWIDPSNIMALLTEEADSDGDIFNVQYLKGTGNGKSLFNTGNSGRYSKTGDTTSMAPSTTTPIDKIHMYVNLIPQEWKLGQGRRPEKWLFTLAADRIIIRAKKLGLNHNRYPVVVCAPDFDGYSVTPLSRMETIYGLQTTLDWLFNCYDDQTEVLTKRGWVPLPNANQDDEVATVNPLTKELTFEVPKQWFEYDYDGYMVNFVSSRMDVCVTPNHNMFVKRRYERVGERDGWQFKPAALLGDTDYLTLGNVRWEGVRPSTSLLIEGKSPQRYRGNNRRYKDTEINPMVLAGFLGWFLSEGSISGGNCTSVKQSKVGNYKDIDSLFEAMPFHVTVGQDVEKHATSWAITDKRLYGWLKENCYEGGTTGEFKKIPRFVMEWDDFHLNLLFERAMWGDGYWMPGHENLGNYSSKSKQLVDDMQEIAIRLGYFSHVRETTTPAGLPFYVLQISTASTFPYIAPANCFKSEYKGKVYCFENSTHLTVTRRNGKVAIHGQSHIANVRKAINDMLVVDPSLININDLKDPQPGKLVRLRRSAWGRDVKGAVQQLAVVDVTKQHIQDSAYVVDLMQKCSAAVDSVMGVIDRRGERVSATESRDVNSNALSRLAKAARVTSIQAMHDIGYMFASHTQQLMSKELWVTTTGRWAETLEADYGDRIQTGKIKVMPWDLSVDYDLTIKDGSVMSGDAMVWTQLFQVIATQQPLLAAFDLPRIFKHIARLMGAKDVDEFVIKGGMPPAQMSMVPDQLAIAEKQAGNIVPVGGAA